MPHDPAAPLRVGVTDSEECPLSYVPEMGSELLCDHPLNQRKACPYEHHGWPCKFLRERSVLVVLVGDGGNDER
jgi:hypothetical protein